MACNLNLSTKKANSFVAFIKQKLVTEALTNLDKFIKLVKFLFEIILNRKKRIIMSKISKLFKFVACASSLAISANMLSLEDNYGSMVSKLRIGGAFVDGKQKDLTKPPAGNDTKGMGALVNHGTGIGAAMTMFLDDRFAFEASVDLTGHRLSNLGKVYSVYQGGIKPTKRKQLITMPISATAQFHPAPYGAIRPYVGVGGHYSYLYSQARNVKFKSGGGFVGQLGADIVMENDVRFTIDARYFSLKSKVKYTEALVNKTVNGKVKLDPIIVTAGIGWSF